MQGVVLDGSAHHFSLHAPGKYALELPLPHPVDEDAVTAKFHRKTRVLTVTLPRAATA